MKLRDGVFVGVAAGLMLGCGATAPEVIPEPATQAAALPKCLYVEAQAAFDSPEEACAMSRKRAPQFCAERGGVQSIGDDCMMTDGPPYRGAYRVCCND